jgi:hypothetical protein
MTWRGVHPIVAAATKLYRKGVRVAKDAMAALEQRLTRDPDLGRWFLTIAPLAASGSLFPSASLIQKDGYT